jgi:hypothetical protein
MRRVGWPIRAARAKAEVRGARARRRVGWEHRPDDVGQGGPRSSRLLFSARA